MSSVGFLPRQLGSSASIRTAGKRSWGGWRGTEFNEDGYLNERFGGKLGFAEWTNKNMIVSAQIESKTAFDNLDAILAVKGLTSIAGGPNDFAASLGFPGQADHPYFLAFVQRPVRLRCVLNNGDTL